MKQCKGCVFYDEMFDRIHQSDVIVEDEDEREIHFCMQFRGDGIPDYIVKDEVNCEYRCEGFEGDSK